MKSSIDLPPLETLHQSLGENPAGLSDLDGLLVKKRLAAEQIVAKLR